MPKCFANALADERRVGMPVPLAATATITQRTDWR
jgi:hypothetical protein